MLERDTRNATSPILPPPPLRPFVTPLLLPRRVLGRPNWGGLVPFFRLCYLGKRRIYHDSALKRILSPPSALRVAAARLACCVGEGGGEEGLDPAARSSIKAPRGEAGRERECLMMMYLIAFVRG